MYEVLEKKLQRLLGETGFELSRCHDVYRLALLAEVLTANAREIHEEAKALVREVERGD